MLGAESVPYSRKALENLAQALGVDTAVIWYNPTTNRIDLKETARHDEDHEEWMEEMEEED